MFKSILSVLGGTAFGIFTISIVQYLGQMVYPLPANIHLPGNQAGASYWTQAPLGALLLVLMAYALGSFLGGMVAARYAPTRPVMHALLAGAVLLFFGLMNLWQMPRPLWFTIVAILLFVPMAYFGGKMSAKRIP